MRPLLLFFFLMGCSPRIDYQGCPHHNFDPGQIQKGLDTKEKVVERFGTPTLISLLNGKEEQWYYLTRITKSLAFLNPQVVEQKNLTVVFNREGIVKEVHYSEPKAIPKVSPASEKTKTKDYEESAVRDFVTHLSKVYKKGPPSS